MKKTIFSGIQPTAVFTLGNYMGAIRNWSAMQAENSCIYSIVDMHAITVRQDPVKLRTQTMNSYALAMACGIDVKRSILFVQSHNRNHAEMNWILSCSTQFGELSRMTQYKDKAAKHADDVNAGLFTYPVLMAGDILLYNADLVPIGADQKQHLELTRNVAERFNHRYGDFFKIPEAYIPEGGAAKIMSLQDPAKKMSKSDDNPNASVYILESKDDIIRKFKRAVTDSGAEVRFSEDKPGVSNLMTIYSVFTGKTMDEIETEFAGHGYGDFKLAVGEAVANALAPVREEYERLVTAKDYLRSCMKDGAEAAFNISDKTLKKAYRTVGFIV